MQADDDKDGKISFSEFKKVTRNLNIDEAMTFNGK
jgi:hypothetical protein